MTTMVALHGAYGAPSDWDAVWSALEGGGVVGHRICPFLPGHDPDAQDADDSVPSICGELSIWGQGLAALTEAVVDGAGPVGPLHLVGYSMGARLALGLAFDPTLRGRVRRLTLVSGSAGIDDDDDQDGAKEDANEGERRTRAAVDDERAAALVADPARFLADFWAMPLFSSLRRHPGFEAALAARVARAQKHPARLAAWMAGLSVGRQPSYWTTLPDLPGDVEVDLVVGADDAAYVAHAARFARVLRRARVHTVENAGHSLLIEAPHAVASVIAGRDVARSTS